jgi:hypothetical protein
MSGLVGFTCPKNGKNVKFDYCFDECPETCYSLPLLHALSRGGRVKKEGIFSVTEILNPPQIVFLRRKFEHYAKPESLIWATFGTAWHAVVEKEKGVLEERYPGRFDVEKSFEIAIDGIGLTGRIDLYDHERKELIDYKTTKGYSVKKMRRGDWEGNNYKWQQNIYRVFAYPDARRMTLSCAVKDHSNKMWEREKIPPQVRIPVPMIDDSVVIAEVKKLMNEHAYYEKAKAEEVPQCLREDMWFTTSPRSPDFGVPRRCRDYCDVCDVCPQYQKFLSSRRRNG